MDKDTYLSLKPFSVKRNWCWLTNASEVHRHNQEQYTDQVLTLRYDASQESWWMNHKQVNTDSIRFPFNNFKYF